jgi:hypothetical protein
MHFLVIVSAEFITEELAVWGTPRLQFAVQNRQPIAAKRTASCQVASVHIHRNAPTKHGPGANHHSVIG